MEKIAVAMSGGVDSSVAAALLKEQGYQIMGLTMKLWSNGQAHQPAPSRCCSLEDLLDAVNVARRLDIPHYVVNLEEEFRKNIFAYFLDSYRSGLTPNPCIYCNILKLWTQLLKYTSVFIPIWSRN